MTTTTSAADLALFAKTFEANLQQAPQAAKDYTTVFQGDPVGPQWLKSVAAQQPTPTDPPATAQEPTPTNSTNEAPAESGMVLLAESDVRPLLDEVIESQVWPGLVREFGLEQLLQNHELVSRVVTSVLAAELRSAVDQLVSEANAELQSAHSAQSAD
ncbi:hypothetical protein GCM10009804_20200 [Kribbella hippodromi]|uniref:Uncharacterized protein n=1 Tax=Kribbella hippodromi TaxID=434347 RepID=A0ABN2CVK8_9ACTN